MKRTPPFERWMAPAFDAVVGRGFEARRSGTGRAGRRREAPPRGEPVASIKGAALLASLETRSLGTIVSSRGVVYRSARKTKAAAITPISHW